VCPFVRPALVPCSGFKENCPPKKVLKTKRSVCQPSFSPTNQVDVDAEPEVLGQGTSGGTAFVGTVFCFRTTRADGRDKASGGLELWRRRESFFLTAFRMFDLLISRRMPSEISGLEASPRILEIRKSRGAFSVPLFGLEEKHPGFAERTIVRPAHLPQVILFRTGRKGFPNPFQHQSLLQHGTCNPMSTISSSGYLDRDNSNRTW